MYYGDFDTSSRIDMSGCSVSIDGTPTAITTGSAVCRKVGGTAVGQFIAPAGVSSVTTSGGYFFVTVFTGSATNFFTASNDYDVYFGNGVISTTSVIGYKIGQFSLRNRAALYPATAGRTLVVDAAGLADANCVKLGPTGSGTAQTARDIGLSVLLSNGTGTGQLKLASGYVAVTWNDVANPTAAVALTNTTISTTATIGTVTTVTGLTASNLDTTISSRMATYTQPTGFLNAIFQAGTVATTTNLTAGTIAAVSGAVGSVTGSVGSVVATTSADVKLWLASTPNNLISGRVDANAAAVTTTANVTNIAAAALAQINGEVVDTLNVDTYAEPGQAAPPATATLVQRLQYLYKFMRNRVVTTTVQISVYGDDATTVDQKSAVSDNGTTADKGEFTTGP